MGDEGKQDARRCCAPCRPVRPIEVGIKNEVLRGAFGTFGGVRLAAELLSDLKSGAMLLADRGYDADWIRAFAGEHGAWVIGATALVTVTVNPRSV